MQEFSQTEPVSTEERNLAMFVHLCTFAGFFFPFGNFIAPIVAWQLKKGVMRFVEDQAKEALNFQLSMWLYLVIGAVLILAIIGIPILIFLGIYYVVISILAAIRANAGEWYRYPMIIRFIS
jgi:uncharacterized Tic20 family protein